MAFINTNCIKELSGASSFMDMVNILNKYYVLDGKLGMMGKALILKFVSQLIQIANFKPR